MTYDGAIEFLYGLRLFGAKFGLENTFKLAALAGNPQAKLRFIHVAGTNGKGSTCAMLESIYRASGRRTGLFTSPHLVSFRERIQVNRQLISEDEVVRLVTEIQPWLKEFPAGHHPTFFEVVAVMALNYFAAQGCEIVIWETGLGGRLDATNIVTPLASIITNIALDHQQWLGDTPAKIAAEKAGIIKPGVPVITAAEEPQALAVIRQTARELNAPLTACLTAPANLPPLSLLGEHQKKNAALALATVNVLQSELPVSAEAIHTGLTSVVWPGRMQLLKMAGGRQLLLDGAHNVAGVETLRAALKTTSPGVPLVLSVGALQDKAWPGLCQILAPLAAKIHTVPVASERTASAADLAAGCRVAHPAAEVTARQNLADALIACKDEPLVVIAGSLYLVGEALELLGRPLAGDGERGLNEWNVRPANG